MRMRRGYRTGAGWIVLAFAALAAGNLQAGVTVDSGASQKPWKMGTIREIRWSSDAPLTGQVRLELRNYGSTATIKEIAAQAPNLGHFRWRVPGDIPQAFYRIRVTFLSGGASGESPTFMIFPRMLFTNPPHDDSKPSLMRGRTHTLTWTWYGPDSEYLNFLAAFHNGPLVPIANNVPNTGSYAWTIPGDFRLGDFRLTYQIPNMAENQSWAKIIPKLTATPPFKK